MYSDSLYRVSLKCLITDAEGSILVVKESGRSSYDLPGGGMDHGENIPEAIARELREELNFTGNFTHEIIGVDDPAKLLTREVWQLKLIFKVTLDSLNVSAGQDADEVAFIDPNTLKDSDAIPEQKIYEYSKNYF